MQYLHKNNFKKYIQRYFRVENYSYNPKKKQKMTYLKNTILEAKKKRKTFYNQ